MFCGFARVHLRRLSVQAVLPQPSCCPCASAHPHQNMYGRTHAGLARACGYSVSLRWQFQGNIVPQLFQTNLNYKYQLVTNQKKYGLFVIALFKTDFINGLQFFWVFTLRCLNVRFVSNIFWTKIFKNSHSEQLLCAPSSPLYYTANCSGPASLISIQCCFVISTHRN